MFRDSEIAHTDHDTERVGDRSIGVNLVKTTATIVVRGLYVPPIV